MVGFYSRVENMLEGSIFIAKWNFFYFLIVISFTTIL